MFTRKDACNWVQSVETQGPRDEKHVPHTAGSRAPIAILSAVAVTRPREMPLRLHGRGQMGSYYREQVSAGHWRWARSVEQHASPIPHVVAGSGVGPYICTICVGPASRIGHNMLPIHVVQEFAGHSDIQDDPAVLLSGAGREDVTKARAVQASLLGTILPADPTDQKLTNSARNGLFRAGGVFVSFARAV